MLEQYKIRYYNFRLVLFVVLLDIVGVLFVSSATGGESRIVLRQIIGICVGFLFAFIISLIPYEKILKFAPYIFIGSLLLLLLVLMFGVSRGGAKRWIVFPIIGQIQGSEFSKIGLIVFFPWLLQKNEERINRFLFLAIFGVLALIPCYLVYKEPDLSTTIVYIICILSMLFVSGIDIRIVLTSLAIVIPSVATYIWLLLNDKAPAFLKGYQANRILSFVDPVKYGDQARQQINSIMAIGSGQLYGKGLNNSTLESVKSGDFLSEEQTDFIFSVIGEEAGFIGCCIVIGLFVLVVFECLHIANRAKDLSGKLICVGFGAIVAFQSFANIAVTTRIFPNTGLTLPFISYGVSSVLSLHIALGLVLNVSLMRKTK